MFRDFKNYFNEKEGRFFIVKPEAGCQGRGIFLSKDFEEICSVQHSIV